MKQTAHIQIQDIRSIGEGDVTFSGTGQTQVVGASTTGRQHYRLIKTDAAVKQVGHIARDGT